MKQTVVKNGVSFSGHFVVSKLFDHWCHGEMNALSLTQKNNIKLHKSKDVQKYTNPQNPTKYTFV